MTSKHKEIPDLLPNGKVFDFNMVELGDNLGIENFNNKFFSDNNNINQTNKQQAHYINGRINNDPIANFLPNFILNDISKENEDEAFNKNSNNSRMNGHNFFFQDNYDDSENEDNQRLIINTINDLENLDDSNNFGNMMFNNSNNNQEHQIFSDPYDAIFATNLGNSEQEIFSDGNFAYTKNIESKNKINNSHLNKKISSTPRIKPSNLISNPTSNNKKDNSFEYSNNNLNCNFNEEQNFFQTPNDINIDPHNFNKNFQKEFNQIQSNMLIRPQSCFQNPNNLMNQNFGAPHFNDLKNNYNYNLQQPNKNINFHLNNSNPNIMGNTNLNQEFNRNVYDNGRNGYNINMNKHNNQMPIANNFPNNIQNPNQRNFPYVTKNFQMENFPNSSMPNYNASISCSYPNNFNRNYHANTSDSDYSNSHVNQKTTEHHNKISKSTFNPYHNNNFKENCNMIFNNNNYNVNQFFNTQNPQSNNNNPKFDTFKININNNSNILNQAKNSNFIPNNFKYFNPQMTDSHNIEQQRNNSIFNLNKNLININSEKNLMQVIDDSNNNINKYDYKSNNTSKGKIIKNKKNKNKNKNKSGKGIINPENNLCRSFQSMENNNENKTINSNNNHKLKKFINKSASNCNSSFNNNSQEKELITGNSNQIIEIGSSYGSNLSGFSGYYNELVDTSSCNLEDSMKSLDINSQFQKGKLHGYSSEATDSNSKDNSFSSEKRNGTNSPSGFKKSANNLIGNANNKKSLFNKEKKEPLKEMKEDLITFLDNINFELDEYICSQKGSRVLQKYLDKISPEAINYIIKMVSKKFPKLMMDTYGNYFCQKLIQSCSSEQRIQILEHISEETVNISHHSCGTHALQSFLELINLSQEENIILKSIEKEVLQMCYDNNATHVIQKILVCIAELKRPEINIVIIENIKNLVLNSNGICVIKKFINTNKCPDSKKQIYDKIKDNCLEIIQSPFGNYAIQYVLEQWGYEYCRDLILIITENIISLSMQKFSSNVVEKILEFLDPNMKRKITTDLFNPTKLMGFLKNKYGSFVLQKIIKIMTPQERIEMKTYLASKITTTSTKEKNRLNNFLEILHS